MPALLSYIFATFQQIERALSYSFAKCHSSSVIHVLYFSRSESPLAILVPIASTFQLICAIYQQILRPFSYICAKSQHSSVRHLPYVSRQSDPLVIILPNAINLQLHINLISIHKLNPQLYFCQLQILFSYTGAICQQIESPYLYLCQIATPLIYK